MALTAALCSAAAPTPAEFELQKQWVAAKLSGKDGGAPTQPFLRVIDNHDPVQKSARNDKPMKLGDATFTRGLYCHANSRVIVSNLPAGAKAFHATVGVDSNEQTSGGRGSVVFIVQANGKELFKSGVVRENSPASQLGVDINSTTELALIITDAGDGIACDQADWADAYLELSNGEKVYLGDLPIADAPNLTKDPLFSLLVDGKAFFEAGDEPQRSSEKLDDDRVRHQLVWKKSDLLVRCEAVEYRDFPTVEWTVYVKNVGGKDSAIIENLQAIDTTLRRDAGGEFVLHHNTGSPCLPIDYQPHDTPLPPRESKRITTTGGRSTNSDLPYFNIEWAGSGTIVALGWPGQWACAFTRDESTGLRVVGGQERTHFVLHAGEEVRTPLVVMQFYQGDVSHAQNVWRRWMLAHNTPLVNGKPPPPMTGACSSHQFAEMINANEENQKLFVDRYVEEKLGLDYWWMDAGWYVNNGNWPNTGTWEVDKKRFPSGLRAISDHAHEKGVKTIVWFEPERVNPGTWLYGKSKWLLGNDGGDKLLNLGNDEARDWWINHADELITAQGIDLFRSDYNIDPLPFWRAADADDRQGITEIKYVQGFLAYWDELRKRHPSMLIDTCASGGRRNDIETLRRAVPLLRSDYILEPTGQQNHTMGIASWIPYFGTGVNSPDVYIFRSQMCPWLICCYDVRRKDLDYDALRKLHGQWQKIAPLMLKDFYLLTPYNADNSSWAAWQYDDPESGEGFVAAFRREQSVYSAAQFKLRAIDDHAKYEVTDLDDGQTKTMSGRELLSGLSVSQSKAPQSKVITYRRAS